MKRWKEHARIVDRVLELKHHQLEHGGLSVRERAKHDKLMGRIKDISRKDSEEIAAIMNKVNH